MRRREFSIATTAAAAALAGCGGGGGGAAPLVGIATVPAPAADPVGTTPAAAPAPLPTSVTAEPEATQVVAGAAAMGTNLSGMEWARPGLRYGQSTMPNLNFTVPRTPDVTWLAAAGYSKNRLPIQWELLQPMLHDTRANAAARAAIGNPGEFHAGYESYITGVLDAHAAAGAKCIIDCHNYCRYQDFRFQGDGSVAGLTTPGNPLLRAYTSDSSQVFERIFALAPGATLSIANFTDFWTRVANRWKNHPGLGGYGLMNEPHDMPAPGGTTASYGGEDLTIWPTFAQAAINAIRAVDASTAIYLAGNEWQAVMTIGTKNPGWPLAGANIVYDVHMYLDAYSNGFAFDYDTETGKNFSAGVGNEPINPETGVKRLKIATDWAKSKGVKLALTEVGMPIDDSRWEEMFKRAIAYARAEGVEIYTWMGGNHWPIRNYAINNVPGWHQNKTLEPAVTGPLKAIAGVARATIYDDGGGYAVNGNPVTITVYARGFLAADLTLTVSSSNGGSLSRSSITLAAGPNSQVSYTFTPASNTVTTLTYSGSAQVPPPRKVYSLADPVAYASTSLADAALALVAKYAACKWEMADGHTDYMLGAPSADGQPVRAVSDSGYGSSAGNAMEMINWINKEGGNQGTMSLPVMRTVNGRKAADHTIYDTFGLWCKKSEPMAGVQASPKNRVPYNVDDAHFAIAAVSVPDQGNGIVFQASKAEAGQTSELAIYNGQPQARWIDGNGKTVQVTSPAALAANAPAVISLMSAQGSQNLRVNASQVGTTNSSLSGGVFSQMMIGWGFRNYYPQGGFMGHMFSVIAGKGQPTAAEMAVMERYLGSTAGVSF
jgi:hypothetical protein